MIVVGAKDVVRGDAQFMRLNTVAQSSIHVV